MGQENFLKCEFKLYFRNIVGIRKPYNLKRIEGTGVLVFCICSKRKYFLQLLSFIHFHEKLYVLYLSVRSGLLIMGFKACILTAFYLFALSVTEKCVEISYSDNVFVNFSF